MRRAPPFIHIDRSSSLLNACIVPTYAQTGYTSSGEVSFSFDALEVGKDRKRNKYDDSTAAARFSFLHLII